MNKYWGDWRLYNNLLPVFQMSFVCCGEDTFLPQNMKSEVNLKYYLWSWYNLWIKPQESNIDIYLECRTIFLPLSGGVMVILKVLKMRVAERTKTSTKFHVSLLWKILKICYQLEKSELKGACSGHRWAKRTKNWLKWKMQQVVVLKYKHCLFSKKWQKSPFLRFKSSPYDCI